MRPAFYALLGVLLVPTVGLVGDVLTDRKFTSTLSPGAPFEVASGSFYYRVRAVNTCTAGKGYSAWSDSDRTVVESVLPTLTVSLAGTGSGTVTSTPVGIDCGDDCSEQCPEGTTMNLSATPDMGSQFSSWGGDDDCTDGSIVMDSDKACTATFDSCSGQSIYDVPAQSVSGAIEFEACNVLRAGTGGFQITGTGDVTFYAGNSIELQNGFVIANGGAFSAVIGAPMRGVSTPLLNGDFESGRAVWTEFSSGGWPLILQSAELLPGVTPHSGSWAAWLGGYDDATDYIEQYVTIPVSTPYLTYWHWIASEDACGYDFAAVVVDSSVVDVYDLCSPENTGGWTRYSVNLSSYASSTVDVQIRVETDSSLNSNLFVDDVSFAVSP